MQRKSSEDLLLIDTHVHIHDSFNLNDFFNSAFINFRTAASKYFNTGKFTGILCLTESAESDYFKDLSESGTDLKDNKQSEWRIKTTEEESSLIAEKSENVYLIIIAGRQIITEENLEVLALAAMKKIPDGLSLKNTVEEILNENGISVLPWGAGKWIGERGGIMRSFLENSSNRDYFLGDNSGRPILTPEPELFKLAAQKGIKVLRGSDPLPLKAQEKKAGSFGIGIQEKINLTQPAAELKRILRERNKETINFGKLEFPLIFFKNQIIIQVKNRIGKRFK